MTNLQYHSGAIDAAGCISNGWNLIKPNYGMYLGIALLTWVLVACIPCLNVLLMGPVTAGFYYVLLRDMRGESVDFSMMFKGFEKLGPTLAVGVLQAIPGIIWQVMNAGMDLTRLLLQIGGVGSSRGADFYQAGDIALAGGILAAYIVAIVVMLLFTVAWSITFAFALPLVIEHDLGPIEAIKYSARAGWSNVGGLIVLSFLLGLLLIVGVLALCVGVFLVLPVVYAAWAFAYRQVFPAVGQVFPTGPPPPSAYQGSFGQNYS